MDSEKKKKLDAPKPWSLVDALKKKLQHAEEKFTTAVTTARTMEGGTTKEGFAKNLFVTVQGVKHDAICPHALPYYACMSCSH
jgi:hypothetical protein